MPPFHIVPLNLDWPALGAYWSAAHPLQPLDPPLLRERITAPGFDGALAFAARDGAGALLGLAVGVFPLLNLPATAGLRWLGCRPECVGRGVLPALAAAASSALQARGATAVRIHATPPFYVRPGIDVRETGMISELLRAGWRHAATHANLTCDLTRWQPPAGALVCGTDAAGYTVRRAEPRDAAPLDSFNREHFTEGWALESALAFGQNPISAFVAEHAGQLAGYACAEVSQCNGSFGPTGVAPEHRHAGLGRRLLWAILQDLQARGRTRCEIGWVGPVPFYHEGCGATIGPVFWMLERELGGPPQTGRP